MPPAQRSNEFCFASHPSWKICLKRDGHKKAQNSQKVFLVVMPFLRHFSQMPRILSLWGKIRAMEVRLYPNSRRPGVGLKPRRESQRPLLPQHARHCPVLEAGSALGLLVYPPLEPHESFHIEFQGDGKYQFAYFLSTPDRKWQGLFTLVLSLPLGSIGMMKEDVEFMVPNPPISREEALRVARTFIVPEDLGPPPGALSLR